MGVEQHSGQHTTMMAAGMGRMQRAASHSFGRRPDVGGNKGSVGSGGSNADHAGGPGY